MNCLYTRNDHNISDNLFIDNIVSASHEVYLRTRACGRHFIISLYDDKVVM